MKYFIQLIFLLSICAPQSFPKAQTGDSNARAAVDSDSLPRILAKVQSKLDELRLAGKFPGGTVGFVLPDGGSGSVSSGVADLENKTPLKPSDRLPAGSVGKTFVAAVTLLLVQEGKLKLDEKIENWLGSESWFRQLPNARDITLRMLLNHSSGIPDHLDKSEFAKALMKSSVRDIKYEELIAYILNDKPLFQAGRGYSYADINYILIGMIVEKVSGKTLYDEITQRILKPLKLDRTIPSNSLNLPEVANGYSKKKPMIVAGKFVINPQWEWAGGGFASTAEDLARWAKALYGGDVLQKDSLTEMLQSTAPGSGYGLGVEIVQSKWGKSYGHDGEFPGYLSETRYFPQHRLAVAIQVNSDETSGTDRFLAFATDDFAQIIIHETSARKLSDAEKDALQNFTESWLGLIDNDRIIDSWEELSAELKAKYARDKWPAALQPLLRQVGKIKTRKLRSVEYLDPEAGSVVVDFQSSFAKVATALEIVTLKLEGDKKWHVVGYSIKTR